MWKDHIHKEEEGKFASMIKGIDMHCVSTIPITDTVADKIHPEYFNDPYLVAK
jgi:hypothetical protein